MFFVRIPTRVFSSYVPNLSPPVCWPRLITTTRRARTRPLLKNPTVPPRPPPPPPPCPPLWPEPALVSQPAPTSSGPGCAGWRKRRKPRPERFTAPWFIDPAACLLPGPTTTPFRAGRRKFHVLDRACPWDPGDRPAWIEPATIRMNPSFFVSFFPLSPVPAFRPPDSGTRGAPCAEKATAWAVLMWNA